ncbi:Fe-S cluster assembly iron-binding protein IscA [Nocardia transvalensis]|uniref:Fe-S cluster assembly iron-binding protein IscA n=1 Tax=Nocardia transvalensis TaxID=37333 RepID=A0A7W9PII7_9NOCA|nr:hypothetical protein [Nocardia transvalensis]MBB5916525.1 Fe-S cluster assembly iron-binding protein IscA [Nocardia transvalensis]
MLMLTPTAIEVVRTITSAEGTPQDAGLRIFTDDGAETLQLALAAEPAETDKIMDAEGSRIFLDQQAAAYLDDKILDAGVDGNGQSSFVLGSQGSEPSAE